jgi:hypothetical protein
VNCLRRRSTGAGTITLGIVVLLEVLLAWAAEPARAQDEVIAGPEFPPIHIHGFGSQGFILTTDNDYVVADSTRGSFQMSEVGLNLTTDLTENLRFGLQFIALNFGPSGSYSPQVDWFYLDYRFDDWLGFRAGRLKMPYGLFNEVNDIDAARVPVLLPQSVYPLQSRSFLFAQTGAEIYGFARSSWAGSLEYRLWGGTIYIDPKLVVPVGSAVELQFNVPYAFGGRALWETPLRGLRLAGTLLKLRLDAIAFIPMAGKFDIVNNTLGWVASADYALGALVLTAEYGRGRSKQETVIPGSNLDTTGEYMYGMATYALTRWLQPGVYYSLKYPDVEKKKGLSNKQHDWSFTLRFDINEHWLVKLEGHYMAGTAGLVSPLRVAPVPADAARHWGVFLAKTTAYF